MTLDRSPTPGRAVTWVGPHDDVVKPGDRGTFVDVDGSPDSYVVDFGPGRVFCCAATEVEFEPDLQHNGPQ